MTERCSTAFCGSYIAVHNGECLQSSMAWQGVYARFAKWRDEGILEAVFQALSTEVDIKKPEHSFYQHPSPRECKRWEKAEDTTIGRFRSGLTTKICAIVDDLGNLVVFLLSPGNNRDSTHAIEVLRKVQIEGSNVLGG